MEDALYVFKKDKIEKMAIYSGAVAKPKSDPLTEAAMMDLAKYAGWVGSIGSSHYNYYYDASGIRHELTKLQLKSNVQYVVSVYNPNNKECIDSFFVDETQALQCYAQEYPADAVVKYIDLNKDTGEDVTGKFYTPSDLDTIDLRPVDGKMRKIYRTLSAIPAGAAVYVTDAGIVELAEGEAPIIVDSSDPVNKRVVKEYLAREDADYTKNREQRRAKLVEEKPYWAKYNEAFKRRK